MAEINEIVKNQSQCVKNLPAFTDWWKSYIVMNVMTYSR